jgi:mRNA-degrading endonuclease toxin of MazEF toxin-antitoxin module
LGGEQQGNAHLCLILTINSIARKFRNVSVAPLTSSPRGLPPLLTPIPSADKTLSMALSHQLRTIKKARIEKIGSVGPQDMSGVQDGIGAGHRL